VVLNNYLTSQRDLANIFLVDEEKQKIGARSEPLEPRAHIPARHTPVISAKSIKRLRISL